MNTEESQTKLMHIVFTDLHGYSKLSSNEVRKLWQDYLPIVYEKTKQFLDKAISKNTWGDALFVVFESIDDALGLLISYRDAFKALKLKQPLQPRLSAHSAEGEVFFDPFTNSYTVSGDAVALTARIEPIVRPGEVFVTTEFVNHAATAVSKNDYKFERIGYLTLAKKYGEIELHRLIHKTDRQYNLPRLFPNRSDTGLPKRTTLRCEEEALIASWNWDTPLDSIRSLRKIPFNEVSGEFLVQLARNAKKAGLWNEALEFIQDAVRPTMMYSNIPIPQISDSNIEIRKTKADCLSRLGRFREAILEIYALSESGVGDSETIAMLAAQFKRLATMQNGEIIDPKQIDIESLQHAKDLYLEAFRRNLSDYYPAINAAYLLIMLGFLLQEDVLLDEGQSLASYVADTWGQSEHGDWWSECTYCEALFLKGDSNCLKLLNQTRKRFAPDHFQLKAVSEQIEIFVTIAEDPLKTIAKGMIEILKKEEK